MKGEVARPEKSRREVVEALPREDLVFQPVTETQDQRNAGTSIVQSLLNKGYIKPEDPELLQATPNGLTFNLIKPKADHIADTARNNRRAKSMEGFKSHPLIKESSLEETKVKGQTILDEASKSASSEHDG